MEIPKNHPHYNEEVKESGRQMVEDFITDYPPAFEDQLEPGGTVDHPP